MFILKNSYKIRKRPYLLLEVLIALVLVTICAVPLLRPYLSLYMEEKAFLRDLDFDRSVNELHIDTIKKIYKHESGEFSWEDFDQESTAPIELNISGLKYKGWRIIKSVSDVAKANTYRLLELRYTFAFSPHASREYTFYLPIYRSSLVVTPSATTSKEDSKEEQETNGSSSMERNRQQDQPRRQEE